MKSLRRKRTAALPDDQPIMDISSLIDVSFLLLIYFLVTATLTKKEQDLSVALAGERPESALRLEPMLIRLEAPGLVWLGEKGSDAELVGEDENSREIPRLKQRLELYKTVLSGSGAQPLVQLHVGGEVKNQRVLDVLNTLAGSGIHDVTFTDVPYL